MVFKGKINIQLQIELDITFKCGILSVLFW